MGAARRRRRALRQGRARAPPVAERRAGRAGMAVARGDRLDRPGDRRPAARRRPLRAGDDRRGAGGAAVRPCGAPRRPPVAPVHAGGGRRAAGDEGRAAGPAGAALRLAAPGGARAGAGEPDARRERRRAALQARDQLGPGHAARVPPAPGLRGARAHGPRRPVPARAAGALPAHLRRRAGRQRARGAGPAALGARLGDRRRPPLARDLGGAARHRGPAGRRAAAVPARRRRLRPARRGARSWPTSRASARPSRRWPRWRPTAPTRRSWSAPRA